MYRREAGSLIETVICKLNFLYMYNNIKYAYHSFMIVILPLIVGFSISWWIAFSIFFLAIFSLFVLFFSPGVLGERRYFHFFGKTIKILNAENGLEIVAPLITVISFPSENIESKIPDKPENIFHGSETDLLPPGMTRTLRITTNDTDVALDLEDEFKSREDTTSSTNDELRRSLTLETRLQVIWKVCEHKNDPVKDEESVSSYVKKFKNAKDAEQAIIEKTISLTSELFGKKTPATLLENQDKCKEYVLKRLKKYFEILGIDIVDFFILDFGLPKKVSEALSAVPAAQLNAKASEIAEAQAAKNLERTNQVGIEKDKKTKEVAREDMDKSYEIDRKNQEKELEIIRINADKTGIISARNLALAVRLSLAAKAKGTKQLATELDITEKEILLILPALEKIAENPNLNLNLFSGGDNDMMSKLLTKFLTKKEN